MPTAKAQIAELWMRASDRQAVTDSGDRIDKQLRDDADKKGTILGPYRVFHDNPLSALDSVDDGDCMVKVIQLRQNK